MVFLLGFNIKNNIKHKICDDSIRLFLLDEYEDGGLKSLII